MLNIGSRWASGFRSGPILLAHIETAHAATQRSSRPGGLNLVFE